MPRRLLRWFDSLTFRLTGTLILALIVLLGVAAIVQITLQEHYAQKSAQINGLALNESLYGALHSNMLGNNREQMRESVRLITRIRRRCGFGS